MGLSKSCARARTRRARRDLKPHSFDNAYVDPANQANKNSLYGDGTGAKFPDGRAFKVSYNRPFDTRSRPAALGAITFLFSDEYPMHRWLEANGYDVTYTAGTDVDGGVSSGHKVFASIGHDEYWSKSQRDNIETARANGMHLAFFSGNECFWKTRWENDANGQKRTLVCYKETYSEEKIDPTNIWTGTWRDPLGGSYDAGKPDNELTGTLFTVNGIRLDNITVPARYRRLRLWRFTPLSNQPSTDPPSVLANYTLGFEWDEDLDNGFRPLWPVEFSSVTYQLINQHLAAPTPGNNDGDPGVNFTSGPATHSLMFYKHASGALVFGAGTTRWSWGLDATHDAGDITGAAPTTDVNIQQAMVNLLGDMGVVPATPQSGLVTGVAASQSLWNAAATPATITVNDPNPVELGLKFQSLAAGNVVGLRFYKGPQNSGTHVGNLWDSSGNNLATVTFTGEMASGWQTASGGNGVYLYGAGGFPTNTFQATNYWVDVLLQSHDTVPPLTVITSPAAGASLIQGAQVQITGTATDAAGFVGGIEVSVDGGTKWHPAQPASGSLGLENWTYAWTPTTIGAATIMARAVDDSPNQESPGASVKVTVVASSTQSLWPNDPTPATATVNDPNAVELGVKFQSSQAGKILGIRFYKGPQNTGTHIGTLWDASGNQLARVTFSGETASGWQTMNFSAPVNISANTTYVASYHTAVGFYSVNGNYFQTAFTNGALTALANGSGGGNGVYLYGPGGFPSNTFNANNYGWMWRFNRTRDRDQSRIKA